MTTRHKELRALKTIHVVLFIALAIFLLVLLVDSLGTSGPDASKYFVVVDRDKVRLDLFEREGSLVELRSDTELRLVRTYPIAVGAAGFDTPSGLRRILYKEKNPTWQAPNRPWAGDLAGQTIAYGDARNPIKSRFIGLGKGIGIHGTAERWSIGGRASHGCIRMRVQDIERLYEQIPVGTPVLIR